MTSEPRSAAAFPVTPWSWIVAARQTQTPEGRDALAELCRAYWYPVYGLIRRRGYAPADAADLTQDYFARLLSGRLLAEAQPGKGRFRAFLQTDCRFFLADERDRRRTIKRGGAVSWIPLDADAAEARLSRESGEGGNPEQLFDRAWALALLDRAFERLQREEAEAGRGEAFAQLRTVLVDGPRSVPYEQIAEALGTTVTAARSAAARLRGRYRAVLRAEIAVTLDEPSEADIDEELAELRAALAR